MKVILRVDKGSNIGTRYELSLYTYRAVGRAGQAEVTVQLSEAGDQELDADDLRLVEEHLANRKSAPKAIAGEPEADAYRRGRDILIEDEKISRKHAMFFFDEEGPSLVDLRSTNGTFVNGARRSEADLEDGDIVNIGKTRFIVSVLEANGSE